MYYYFVYFRRDDKKYHDLLVNYFMEVKIPISKKLFFNLWINYT